MRQIWDFNGGIHPPEHKSVSNQNPIQSAGIPGQLVIPLQQHIGGPADPLVKVGDTVLKGQKLAEPLGFISAAVHAPTSGTIADICDLPVAHPSGMTDCCIVLIPDGNDQWIQLEQRASYTDLSPNEILHIIRDKGIAGMGGAGFPTEVKLHPPKQDKVKTLILNGAECEPYITADDMLMRERASEIILGLEIMAFILEPDECLIGIEDNKPEAIDAMRAAVAGTKIQVVVIPTKYPSGGEKQLIKILTGQEVPSGSIPADVGVMCQNVATAAAIYRAVYFDEPLISRIITLTGDALQQPGNYEILIGSQVGWLLELAGAREQQISRTIMGGPMMGFTIQSADVPAIKTSNCIIAGTREELPPPPPAQACIRCGICVEACPMELLPQQLYWFSKAQEFEKAEHHNIADCIECGACSYVCPSSIPLVQYYRYAKGEIRQHRLEQAKSDKARNRFEFRQERQERELAEKDAKRKARAEAAAQAQAKKRAEADAEEPPKNAAAADDRKAAVAAALERVAAKKSAPATDTKTGTKTENTPQRSLTDIQADYDKALAKLDKLKATAQELESDDPAREKMERAISKNETRVEQARLALEDAKNNQKPDSADTPSASETVTSESQVSPGTSAVPPTTEKSLDELQAIYEKAQAKQEKLQNTLADLPEGDPAREKMIRAIDKNEGRVIQAKQEWQAAQSATATLPIEIEQLEQNVEKARLKLDNMKSSLDDAKAHQPELVEKLQRAVQKNEMRLSAAEQALEEARKNSSTTAKNDTSPSTKPTHDRGF